MSDSFSTKRCTLWLSLNPNDESSEFPNTGFPLTEFFAKDRKTPVAASGVNRKLPSAAREITGRDVSAVGRMKSDGLFITFAT